MPDLAQERTGIFGENGGQECPPHERVWAAEREHMATLGTAGHVDHGKSTLVQALTGIDPDRLAEEKARGMTIDLGFAWLTLPDGRTVSIVDVPGHEDFIKNMLAGVGGIDLALLVVAADEGTMPQTREHLAILDLLHIPRSIVALTKRDLVDDDWLALVQEDIAALLRPTRFAAAPIIPVSARTGAGLDELRAAIAAALPTALDAPSHAPPRLPIDRVFTITGFGTVVTGTLLDGAITVGQEVAILPSDQRARVRGIQQHKAQVGTALPGTRVALNLAGVARQDVARGMVVTLPGALSPSTLLDVRLECWSGAPQGIAHNAVLDLAIGAAETTARVRLLESDTLAPGDAGWAQLRLTDPVAVVSGDRFILRLPSPSATLGGGSVVDPAARHHRRNQSDVLARLAALASGDAAAIVLTTLMAGRGSTRLRTIQEIARQTYLPADTITAALAELAATNQIRQIGAWYVASDVWQTLREQSQTILAGFHEHMPLRLGMSREEWRARLDLAPAQVEAVLAALIATGEIAQATTAQSGNSATLVRLPDHAPRFTPAQATARDALLARLETDPWNPPPFAEMEQQAGRDVIAALVESGTLVRLGDDILLPAATFAAARDAILAHLRAHERITVAEARDLLGATRRTIVPLLATLDALHLTHRVGDLRVLGLAARA
jgi:selenocysteine-specific elongation factor